MKPQDRDHRARWRRRKEARPAEILDAALACFTEHGFAATRLDEVARRAGVTKGTLYLYFDNKEDLFKAVVRRTVIPNIEKIEAIIYDTAAPASLLLERLIRNWVEIILSPASAIPKLMVAEAGNFPDLARFYLDEVVHRGMTPVRRVLCAGIERGEFRAVDVESAVVCVLAPLLFTMLWRHSLGRHEPGVPDPAMLCAAHLHLLLGGLLDRPAVVAAEAGAPIPQEERALP
jgi:AcrR family transcriptional regulator